MKKHSKKTVVVLGDSFIYGHGCKDRIAHIDPETGKRIGDPRVLAGPPSKYAWASLLSKEHGDRLDVYNISFPGLDCQSLVSALANLLDNTDIKPDMIIYNSIPGGRLLFRAHINTDGTPYHTRLVNIHDDTKSPNWAVFRQCVPLGATQAVVCGSDALSVKQNDALMDFAGHLYHDALGVQLAVSSLLACLAIANSYDSKFIWAATSYCPARLNARGVIPKKILDTLELSMIKHVAELQRTNWKKYTAPDEHSNELCHEDYYRDIIKPKIAELFK